MAMSSPLTPRTLAPAASRASHLATVGILLEGYEQLHAGVLINSLATRTGQCHFALMIFLGHSGHGIDKSLRTN
jgi:hypothetical protein